MKLTLTTWNVSLLLCLLAAATGCRSPAEHRRAADREVYRTIAAKEQAEFGHTRKFNIDTRYSGRDPAAIPPEEIIQDRQRQGRLVVDLEKSLLLALTHNREYQTHKENLFLAALSLSDARHGFRPNWDGEITAGLDRDADGERSGGVTSQISVGGLLKGGTNLSVTLINDLLTFFTGTSRRSAVSTISVNLTQPLLGGAASKVAAELLTQAERDVVYEIRSFSRFQKTFAVDIATSYYRLARLKDTIYNEYNNYQNLIRARERAEALAKDRLPEFQVDQTRQDELAARNRYVLAVEEYLADLDGFKLKLGLPLDQSLTVDPSSLAELMRQDLRPVRLSADKAFSIALAKRLDLLNEIDRFEDAKRKIKVAESQLKSDVEFFANASLESLPDTSWTKFSSNNWQGSFGLRLKLPLDRLLERNSYRREFIDFERQLRSLALAVDGAKTAVRRALRILDQAGKSYRIQKRALELAARRVESANLLLQAGRAETRDLLEAQNALVSARNALTSNLVDYHLARLQLLRDIGMLDLRDGTIVELIKLEGETNGAPAADKLLSPKELFGEKDNEP